MWLWACYLWQDGLEYDGMAGDRLAGECRDKSRSVLDCFYAENVGEMRLEERQEPKMSAYSGIAIGGLANGSCLSNPVFDFGIGFCREA